MTYIIIDSCLEYFFTSPLSCPNLYNLLDKYLAIYVRKKQKLKTKCLGKHTKMSSFHQLRQ